MFGFTLLVLLNSVRINSLKLADPVSMACLHFFSFLSFVCLLGMNINPRYETSDLFKKQHTFNDQISTKFYNCVIVETPE